MPFGGIPHHSTLLLGKPGAFLMDSSLPEQRYAEQGVGKQIGDTKKGT